MRSNPNYDVVKEPRGFIKCLEVFLAIFAFACATGYRGNLKIDQTSPDAQPKAHDAQGTIQYPFSQILEMPFIKPGTNGTMHTYTLEVDQRSKIEFFVFIGVMCFLYSLGMLVYYIFFEENNTMNATPVTSSWLSPPIIDFGLGAFWTLFWFFSACAFAAGVNALKDQVNIESLTGDGGAFTEPCSNGYKCGGTNPKYATMTVAILLGFLNVFVWAGNIWFLYKETPWHNKSLASAGAPSTVQQPPSQPAAAAI